MKNILFFIPAEPGHYPPLINAARIFHCRGFNVSVFGFEKRGSNFDLALPIDVSTYRFRLLKTRLGRLFSRIKNLKTMEKMISNDPPDILYCHEPFSSPLIRLGAELNITTLYHEHDTPCALRATVRQRRAYALERASIVLFPNTDRIVDEEVKDRLGERLVRVRNFPSVTEIGSNSSRLIQGSSALKLYYHGSIGSDRMPLTILDAMMSLSSPVQFTFAGYESFGEAGYIRNFLGHAKGLGLASRVKYLGEAPNRETLLEWASEHDVGWGVVPTVSGDINMKHMIGASNKVYDYMSQGLAVLVSHEEPWRREYSDAGFGLSCNHCSDSIASALEAFASDMQTVRAMGRRGHHKIITSWNYEAEFEPVLQALLPT